MTQATHPTSASESVCEVQRPSTVLLRRRRGLPVAAWATCSVLVLGAGPQVSAQSPTSHHGGSGGHAVVDQSGLRWTTPAAYAPGAQLAVIHGDPAKKGMYVVRLKVPAGFQIAAHTHPNDENVTVLLGSFHIGTGQKLDQTKGSTIKAGGYSYVAKGMTHFAWFTEDTIVQLHGMGPQGVTYVDPADDPRRK